METTINSFLNNIFRVSAPVARDSVQMRGQPWRRAAAQRHSVPGDQVRP
jgi:hypothetical protein